MHVYVCAHAYKNAYKYVYTSLWIYIYMYIHIHISRYIYIYIYTHISINLLCILYTLDCTIYIYIYIDIYIYICIYILCHIIEIYRYRSPLMCVYPLHVCARPIRLHVQKRNKKLAGLKRLRFEACLSNDKLVHSRGYTLYT